MPKFWSGSSVSGMLYHVSEKKLLRSILFGELHMNFFQSFDTGVESDILISRLDVDPVFSLSSLWIDHLSYLSEIKCTCLQSGLLKI